MAKPGIKKYPDPVNYTGNPGRDVKFWDKDAPFKTKNVNKTPVCIGDYVYYQGGEGVVTDVISIGSSPYDDYYLATVGGVKVNMKWCFHSKLTMMCFCYPVMGYTVSIIVSLLVSFILYFIGGLV